MTDPRPAARWSVNVDRIERVRILTAWTRERLANAAQIDPKTLRDMCSGRRRPTLRTVQSVCAALGMAVADVIVFEESGSQPPVPGGDDGQGH